MKAKRRRVTYATIKKWKGELDKECAMATWLQCDTKWFVCKWFVCKWWASGLSAAAHAQSSRWESWPEETLVSVGLLAPSPFAKATFAIMISTYIMYTVHAMNLLK